MFGFGPRFTYVIWEYYCLAPRAHRNRANNDIKEDLHLKVGADVETLLQKRNGVQLA